MTPRNSEPILQARMRGERPADPIVVSFVGAIDWENPQVFAEPGIEYDWRFLVDLPVYIVVKPGIECREAIRGIFRQCALYPTLVDIENKTSASVVCATPLQLKWKGSFE